MRSLAVLAVASLAASLVLAQTSDPSRDASRSAPRQQQSRAGTVTNPPPPGPAASAPAAESDTAPAPGPKPETPHMDGAVKQQAEAKRRAELEHCQTLTGESRADCVGRADAEYHRATSDDTLSDQPGPGAPLG